MPGKLRRLARLEREYAAAALIDPDSVALESPRLPLDARRLRALVDDPCARNPRTRRTEVLLIIAAFAGDPIDRRRTGRRASAFDCEHTGTTAGHPNAVLLVTPRASLNARGLRSLLDHPCAADAAIGRTELLLIVTAVAFDPRARSGNRRRRTIPTIVE